MPERRAVKVELVVYAVGQTDYGIMRSAEKRLNASLSGIPLSDELLGPGDYREINAVEVLPEARTEGVPRG